MRTIVHLFIGLRCLPCFALGDLNFGLQLLEYIHMYLPRTCMCMYMCFTLVCVGHLNSASSAASVAQLLAQNA